ncbi:MAG TPA: AbrB/MazE/SpoVT family DNA-binding domain-containing protein [Pseudolabrys sp.]|nr:AbrB/MazE/SpoVT family DNA-binding domain-containing protein [Pseudolabrys sp.]
MKVKIARWGHSLGLRLPKQFVDQLGLKAGSSVDLEKDGSRLLIDTAPRREIPYYRLEDLLAQIKPGSEPPPFEDWGILPSEWPQDDWSDIAPSEKEWQAAKRSAETQSRPERKRRDESGVKRSALRRRRRA